MNTSERRGIRFGVLALVLGLTLTGGTAQAQQDWCVEDPAFCFGNPVGGGGGGVSGEPVCPSDIPGVGVQIGSPTAHGTIIGILQTSDTSDRCADPGRPVELALHLTDSGNAGGTAEVPGFECVHTLDPLTPSKLTEPFVTSGVPGGPLLLNAAFDANIFGWDTIAETNPGGAAVVTCWRFSDVRNAKVYHGQDGGVIGFSADVTVRLEKPKNQQ